MPHAEVEKSIPSGTSALEIFGISRNELAKIGLAERKAQDRLYRTLTIWSGSIYDSLYSLANGNKAVSTRLWGVYARLVEICNPDTAELASIEVRKEFENKLRSLNNIMALEACRSKEDYEALKVRLAAVERAHEISRGTAETEVPKLQSELTSVRERCLAVEMDLATTIALSKEKDVALQALRDQLHEKQALLEPLTKECQSARDELKHANQEIQRYIDMYLEADRIVRKNESSVNIALGEKERLVVKIAGLMKQSEDKERQKLQAEARVVTIQNVVSDLQAALAESNEQTETAMRNLGKFVATAKHVQAGQAAEIEQLEQANGALEAELDHTQTELLRCMRLCKEQEVRSFASTQMSVVWQQALAAEKQRLAEMTADRVQLTGKLKRVKEEKKNLQGVVAEKDAQMLHLSEFVGKFDECRAELDVTIAARDAAVRKYEATDTEAMAAQVEAMKSDVLALQDTVATTKAEEYRQGKEIKMLRLDHAKKDRAISSGNVLCVTLMALLSSLHEEGADQLRVLSNVTECMETAAEIKPISNLPVKSLQKKLEAEGLFEGVLNREEQAMARGVMRGCVSQRQALVNILPNLNHVPMLKKQVQDLDSELRSMKAWAGKERSRNTAVLDRAQQKGLLEAVALQEELKIEKAEKEKMRVGFKEMKAEMHAMAMRVGDLQEFWDANHEAPVQEQAPVEKEDSAIDFSQFDSDDDAPTQEMREPTAPSMEMPSGTRSNPRLPKVKEL